ncbi:MAG TPA: hypothetical protein VI300_23070 [Solirubrobacter sp.]
MEVADLTPAIAELADRLWERAPSTAWLVGIADGEGRHVEWTEESANVAKRVARRIAAEGAVAAAVARRPQFVGGWKNFEYNVVVAADADVAYLAPIGGERQLGISSGASLSRLSTARSTSNLCAPSYFV